MTTMVSITDIVATIQQKLDTNGISRDSYILTMDIEEQRASLFWYKDNIFCTIYTDDENYVFGKNDKELCFTREEYDKAVEFICELLAKCQ